MLSVQLVLTGRWCLSVAPAFGLTSCFNCYERFFRLCFDFFFNCLSTSCTDALCCGSYGRGCGIHLENLLVELLHSLFFASHNVSFMHVIALSQLL